MSPAHLLWVEEVYPVARVSHCSHLQQTRWLERMARLEYSSRPQDWGWWVPQMWQLGWKCSLASWAVQWLPTREDWG